MVQFLNKEGFETTGFDSGEALLKAFESEPADLLVLDIMMPELDGMQLCHAIRAYSHVPVIFVSARDTVKDKVQGLSCGADDYLTKPFSPLELTARVKSLLRRTNLEQLKPIAEKIEIGNVSIEYGSKQAYCAGQPLGLTNMEFDLLSYLAQRENTAVSRDELLEKVWKFESSAATRATDDMIKRMRRKLSLSGADIVIETVWGYGFKLVRKR